jgi:hypothetical protein
LPEEPKMKTNSLLRPTLAVSMLALAMVAAIAMAGVSCATNAATPLPVASVASPTPAASGSPTPTPTPTPMNNVSVSYQVSPVPGGSFPPVDGYGLMSGPPVVPSATPSPVAPTAAPQGVIAVTMGQTIVFYNFDPSIVRSVSLLGLAGSNTPPPVFTNTQCTNIQIASCSSPQNSAITDPQFQALIPPMTGLVPGHSLGYLTGGVTGSFYYGDFNNYLSNPPMRTIITINP